jgi:hypothetical protein
MHTWLCTNPCLIVRFDLKAKERNGKRIITYVDATSGEDDNTLSLWVYMIILGRFLKASSQ